MISLGITDATPRDVNCMRRSRAVATGSRRRAQGSMLSNALLSSARIMIVARSGGNRDNDLGYYRYNILLYSNQKYGITPLCGM